MSTDRELLELAAKAAGISGALVWTPGATPWLRVNPDLSRPWNPLAYDGDALRLAVKLRLTLDIERDRCCVSVADHSGRFGVEVWGHEGPEGATRRAIVRAAAEIGKAIS